MTARSSSLNGGTLSRWLEDEGFAPAGSDAGAIADVSRVRALLIDAARAGRAVSYAELLGLLGLRFTRPRMRALCKTLDAIDLAGTMAGEPELAVLVVRESDRLPGQGWWVGIEARCGYAGAWEGADAAALVRQRQAQAFTFWGDQAIAAIAVKDATIADAEPTLTRRAVTLGYAPDVNRARSIA